MTSLELGALRAGIGTRVSERDDVTELAVRVAGRLSEGRDVGDCALPYGDVDGRCTSLE